MRRIKARAYGQDARVVAQTGASHVIKIGYNKSNGDKASPGKLNGFCIYRDTLDGANQYVLDAEAMRRLGSSPEMVDAAKKAGFGAPDNLLPHELIFILLADAVRQEDGSWSYPGTISEAYECYNKLGLFCMGDGMNATRKLADGSKRLIACVPYGRLDAEPANYCQFHGPGKPCKLHYRLTVLLMCRNAQGQLEPLVPGLGMQMRARLDSSSKYASAGAFDELDRAADRVRGIMHGLTGSLHFQKKRRRTGQDNFSQSIVGHVFLQMHEEGILRREREIREEEDRQAQNRLAGVRIPEIMPPREVKALPMPQSPAAPTAAPANEPPAQATAVPTPSELAQELHRYVLAITERDGGNYDDTLNEIVFGSVDGGEGPPGKFTRIASTGWFLDKTVPAKKQERRIAMLVEACERIRMESAEQTDQLQEAAPCE